MIKKYKVTYYDKPIHTCTCISSPGFSTKKYIQYCTGIQHTIDKNISVYQLQYI